VLGLIRIQGLMFALFALTATVILSHVSHGKTDLSTALDATPDYIETAPGNTKTVRVGVSHNPPFASHGKGKPPTGFVIDITRAIAKTEKWNLAYFERPWPKLLALLEAGKIDILGGIAYTKARAEKYQFSKQAAASNWAILYRNKNVKIDSIADISGKRVAIIPGSVHATALAKLANTFQLSYQIVAAKNYEETLELLDRGKADVGVVARTFHILFGVNYQALATSVRFNPIEIRFAAPKNAPPTILNAMDQYLSTEKNDPASSYRSILENWFKGPSRSFVEIWFYWIIGGIGILLAVTWVIVFWTHRVIDKRTQELKKSESRFRDFATTTSDWFWEMDENLTLSFMSQRPRILAGQDMNSYIGHKRQDNAAEDTTSEKWRRHQDDMDNRRPFRNFQYDIFTASGQIMPIQISGIPVFDDDGAFMGYRGTGTDISKQKQLEDQLRQAQRMEAVGQLTGGIAHDFNNLLGIMLGNTELLRKKDIDQETLQNRIKNIQDAIDRASSLTSRLLAFSRKQSLSPQTINIADLVSQAHDLLSRTLGETISLDVSYGDGLWPVTIDVHEFENALINLAVNARDAMPNGGSLTINSNNITLQTEQANHLQGLTAGDYVEITVNDTGTGMPEDIKTLVFEPFFTTKDVGKGSGLGLSMVYGFVKQSGGHVTVDNRKDGKTGTVITIFLPRSHEKASQCTPMHPIKEDAPKGTERILVVEDDDGVREIPVNLLSDQGYQIVEAKDGPEALHILKTSNTFDMVFTDVILPGGLTGADIANIARQMYPDIKIVFTTGYSEDVLDNDELDLSDVTIVNKPYQRSRLLKTIRDTLDGTV